MHSLSTFNVIMYKKFAKNLIICYVHLKKHAMKVLRTKIFINVLKAVQKQKFQFIKNSHCIYVLKSLKLQQFILIIFRLANRNHI